MRLGIQYTTTYIEYMQACRKRGAGGCNAQCEASIKRPATLMEVPLMMEMHSKSSPRIWFSLYFAAMTFFGTHPQWFH